MGYFWIRPCVGKDFPRHGVGGLGASLRLPPSLYWSVVVQSLGFELLEVSTQGDPLCPFLFTLAVDVLSWMMLRGEDRGVVKGIRVKSEQFLFYNLQIIPSPLPPHSLFPKKT